MLSSQILKSFRRFLDRSLGVDEVLYNQTFKTTLVFANSTFGASVFDQIFGALGANQIFSDLNFGMDEHCTVADKLSSKSKTRKASQKMSL